MSRINPFCLTNVVKHWEVKKTTTTKTFGISCPDCNIVCIQNITDLKKILHHNPCFASFLFAVLGIKHRDSMCTLEKSSSVELHHQPVCFGREDFPLVCLFSVSDSPCSPKFMWGVRSSRILMAQDRASCTWREPRNESSDCQDWQIPPEWPVQYVYSSPYS